MVINKNDGNVKFVSYTGKYPSLCMGTLTLLIYENGIAVKYIFDDKQNECFWESGGSINRDSEGMMYANNKEWIIDAKKLPKELQKYADEIDKVFNENVEYGCCGGCI